MLGRVDPQGSLLETRHMRRHLVTKGSFYERLADHGHELISDQDFAHLYAPGKGRPSVPPWWWCGPCCAPPTTGPLTPRPPGAPGGLGLEGGHGGGRLVRGHRGHHLQLDAGAHGGP